MPDLSTRKEIRMYLVYKTRKWVRCLSCKGSYSFVFYGSDEPNLIPQLLKKGWLVNPKTDRIEFCPNPECIKKRKTKEK